MKKNTLFSVLLLTVLVSAGLLLTGCSSSNSDGDGEDSTKISVTPTEQPGPLPKEVIADFIQAIPSPLEISSLIKNEGVQYDRTILNTTDNLESYNTNYKRALNLGIYSTDLGYANIYNRTQDALYRLDAVQTLAEGLNIGQFFDLATIRRLATSSSNLDSLLLVTTQNFERISVYLQERNQSELSILLLTGGWLESTYLTCEVERKYGNEKIRQRIGEQKIILDQLLLLLKLYAEKDAKIKELVIDLEALKAHFEKIKVVHEYRESTIKEENGILVVQENSIDRTVVTPEVLVGIYESVTALRKKIIQ